MSRIAILDENVANQIAAGEVVERPASVVKELVENAIDANSKRIDVQIEDGGLSFIRVSDDGNGIANEDFLLAFHRHATSKISRSRDLFRIHSLGFRGEALPSIAAVSKVECTSSATADGIGRRIIIHGGDLVADETVAAERGTDIRVLELFYNTPARLKYMKTIQTELGHISDFMQRVALACPHIAFSLIHGGKTLFRTLGNGDLLQVIAAIYGVTAAKKMMSIEDMSLDFRLTGWISTPEYKRASRSGLTTIVNGRYVRNYGLIKAILDAYHTRLPVHRFPVGVLHVEMDPALVDVNVHPAKLEVRFSKERELFTFIENAIRSKLDEQVYIPTPSFPAAKTSNSIIQEQLVWKRDDIQQGASLIDESSLKLSSQESSKESSKQSSKQSPKQSSSSTYAPSSTDFVNLTKDASSIDHVNSTQPFKQRSASRWDRDTWRKEDQRRIQEAIKTYSTPVDESVPAVFPDLYPIGQMRGTYLLAQNEHGLYLIDQHAAHERIQYEWYYNKFAESRSASQELLIPIVLELTPAEFERLQGRIGLLEAVGVFLIPFGGKAFKVTAYPDWFPDGEEKAIIEEMIEWILAEKEIDLAKLREKSAIICSCKRSIKANEPLTMPQMESLLDRLSRCRNPYTCPHGRPIIVHFSNLELDKMFKRVM